MHQRPAAKALLSAKLQATKPPEQDDYEERPKSWRR
jgi:hypothetical protein